MSISQLRARRERVKPAESIVFLAMVNPKRKCSEVPSSKSQKKRNKANIPVEGAPNKTKLLAFAMSAAKTTEVFLVVLYQCRIMKP